MSGAARPDALYWWRFRRELGCHLREGRRGTRLLTEVVVDERAKQIPVARLVRRRGVAEHQVALKFDEPGELLRTGQEVARERCERLVGEEFDQFRHQQTRGFAVKRVHEDDGSGAIRVSQGEVHRGRTARVVADGITLSGFSASTTASTSPSCWEKL